MEENKTTTAAQEQQPADQSAAQNPSIATPEVNTQPEDNGTANGKERTFTQEDVNRIVSERLKRDRSNLEITRLSELDEREKNISDRENLLECKQFIAKTHYPDILLEYFDTTDSKEFQRNVKRLVTTFPQILNEPQAWGQDHGSSPIENNDLSEAFKPNFERS